MINQNKREKVISLKEQLKNVEPYIENNEFLEVEAEDFHYKTANGTKREWYTITANTTIPFLKDNYSNSASKKLYIKALPDTRVTHDDPLIIGENFFPIAGVGGIVSYKIKITNPGKYYIWGSVFSSGSEDNGLHVGVNEQWPESGERMQWCNGKNEWTWSSAQRVLDNHCGKPNTIFYNFDKAGDYIVSFSMREDGLNFDKWILAKNPNFIP